MSSAFHLPLRPQKTPPDTELRNPADLEDQLAFFARVLLFIPHHAVLRCPVHVYSRRKRRNGKGCYITSGCGHLFHLLALELPKLITIVRPALLMLCSIPDSIQGGSIERVSSMRAMATACAEYTWWFSTKCGIPTFWQAKRP